MFTSLLRTTRHGLRQNLMSKRSFGSAGSAAPKEYHGMEKFVRRYLPENHQIVIFFATIEFGGLGLYFATRSSDEKEEEIVGTDTGSASTEIPSVVDEGFDEWSKLPGNIEKWEQSIEPWAATM